MNTLLFDDVSADPQSHRLQSILLFYLSVMIKWDHGGQKLNEMRNKELLDLSEVDLYSQQAEQEL